MEKKERLQITLGIAVANAIGVGLIGLSKWFVSMIDASYTGVFIYSDFIIVPLLMGIIAAYFWRKTQMNGREYFLYSVVNALVAVAGSWFFLEEGYICLIIVFPLLAGFIVAGAFIGRAIFKRNKNTLNVSVVAILLLLFTYDSLSKHSYENEVSDTMIIHAPAATVWKYVVAYEPNHEKDTYWLFKIGLPSPVQSTVEGYYKGAKRKCIFSNGYTFDEEISVYDENKNLTFDITNQPKDPEIMQHMDLVRGQFLLKDNGNGTTTLTGNSWYRLYVFPAWYYDLWASNIVRNVHVRVMEHIKNVAETEIHQAK